LLAVYFVESNADLTASLGTLIALLAMSRPVITTPYSFTKSVNVSAPSPLKLYFKLPFVSFTYSGCLKLSYYIILLP